MKKVLVMIQENQFSDAQISELEKLLKRLYAEHVSQEKLTVIWSEVAAGRFFTNYAASQTSIVSAECDNGFPQKKRVDYLTALAEAWSAVTGQDLESLMLALVDATEFKVIADSTLRRLSAWGRLRFGMHVASNLMGAKLRGKPLRFSPSL
jgi:hypothetical protein